MAITEAFAASATITTTEWSLTNNSSTLAAQTTAGVYQVFVDTNALAVGDVYELRVYEKVRSSSTQRIALRKYIDSSGSEPANALPALMLMNGWDFTITKISGTDRTVEWSIRKG